MSERYNFPSLGNTQGGLNPSLTLEVVDESFQLRHFRPVRKRSDGSYTVWQVLKELPAPAIKE